MGGNRGVGDRLGRNQEVSTPVLRRVSGASK